MLRETPEPLCRTPGLLQELRLVPVCCNSAVKTLKDGGRSVVELRTGQLGQSQSPQSKRRRCFLFNLHLAETTTGMGGAGSGAASACVRTTLKLTDVAQSIDETSRLRRTEVDVFTSDQTTHWLISVSHQEAFPELEPELKSNEDLFVEKASGSSRTAARERRSQTVCEGSEDTEAEGRPSWKRPVCVQRLPTRRQKAAGTQA